MKRAAVNPKTQKRASLSEFLAKVPSNRGGHVCWMCSIKERPEIDPELVKVWPNGKGAVDAGVIAKWLQDECGYDPKVATVYRVRRHRLHCLMNLKKVVVTGGEDAAA